TASIAFSSASGCMTMIMVDSPKKSGGTWAARRWLKLFARVLSVSAAPGGHPVVEMPSERGCSPHIAIVHGTFDVEDDPGVHGASLAWLTRLADRSIAAIQRSDRQAAHWSQRPLIMTSTSRRRYPAGSGIDGSLVWSRQMTLPQELHSKWAWPLPRVGRCPAAEKRQIRSSPETLCTRPCSVSHSSTR